jgi:hypothetical protein
MRDKVVWQYCHTTAHHPAKQAEISGGTLASIVAMNQTGNDGKITLSADDYWLCAASICAGINALIPHNYRLFSASMLIKYEILSIYKIEWLIVL